jgi:hypothetical protein
MEKTDELEDGEADTPVDATDTEAAAGIIDFTFRSFDYCYYVWIMIPYVCRLVRVPCTNYYGAYIIKSQKSEMINIRILLCSVCRFYYFCNKI